MLASSSRVSLGSVCLYLVTRKRKEKVRNGGEDRGIATGRQNVLRGLNGSCSVFEIWFNTGSRCPLTVRNEVIYFLCLAGARGRTPGCLIAVDSSWLPAP